MTVREDRPHGGQVVEPLDAPINRVSVLGSKSLFHPKILPGGPSFAWPPEVSEKGRQEPSESGAGK